MASKEFSNTLKELRIKAGYSQKQVYEHFQIPQSTFSSWEVGKSEPSGEMLLKLCKFYNCDIMKEFSSAENILFTNAESEMIKKYRNLDDYGRESVDLILDRESQRVAQLARLSEYAQRNTGSEKESIETGRPKIRTVPYYEKLASAGTGQILWDDLVQFDMEILDNGKTKHGDFALGVNGDSMEPIYWDADAVLVEKAQDLQIGEIGVFILDGECFIKELGYKKLVSKNPEYEPIKIDENSNLICVGRVICNLSHHSNADIAYMYERREMIKQKESLSNFTRELYR